MIILGIILLVIGFIAKIAVLWSIGIILVVVGLILMVLGSRGRAVGDAITTDVLCGEMGERFEWTEGRFPTPRGSRADVDRSRCASLIGSTIWGRKAAHWTLWR
jgi:hypothetical protein